MGERELVFVSDIVEFLMHISRWTLTEGTANTSHVAELGEK